MSYTALVLENFNKRRVDSIRFNLYSFFTKRERSFTPQDIIVKREVRYNNSRDDIKYYKEYEFNKNNKKILEVNRNKNGNVRSFVEYKYDKYNREKMCIYYNSTGQINYYNSYEYDEGNNISKETRFSSNRTVLYYIEYKYNRSGELISYNKFGADEKKKVV